METYLPHSVERKKKESRLEEKVEWCRTRMKQNNGSSRPCLAATLKNWSKAPINLFGREATSMLFYPINKAIKLRILGIQSVKMLCRGAHWALNDAPTRDELYWEPFLLSITRLLQDHIVLHSHHSILSILYPTIFSNFLSNFLIFARIKFGTKAQFFRSWWFHTVYH